MVDNKFMFNLVSGNIITVYEVITPSIDQVLIEQHISEWKRFSSLNVYGLDPDIEIVEFLVFDSKYLIIIAQPNIILVYAIRQKIYF